MALRPRHPRRFRSRRIEPFNFLNLDLYAQDTWKVTRKLTWTFGMRDTFNSNPLNPHDQIARLRGSFASISHDVNQPLNAAIQTGLGNVFSSTPLAILQPRTAIAWQFEPKSVLRAGFGIFSDILAGKHRGRCGRQSAIRENLSGRPAGDCRRHRDRAGSSGQRGRRDRRRESNLQPRDFRKGNFPAPRRSESSSVPAARGHHSGAGWKTSCALFHGVEPRPRARTRNEWKRARAIRRHARHESTVPDAGEWLSDRMRGLLRAVSVRAADRPAIRRRDAIFHRREQPLQRPATDRR